MVEQHMIEEALQVKEFHAWVLSQKPWIDVGWAYAGNTPEAYPASAVVVAQYLQDRFPGESIWVRQETVGYWAKEQKPGRRTFTLDAERFGWAITLQKAIDAKAEGTNDLLLVAREQVLSLLRELHLIEGESGSEA